tara:strand:+ start:13684 stop:14805 length:1122 start_codon:yes stop_codon:yes gene_type:complete
MKIIFICGSLESGKDGVGDYTRRLCGELINQGIAVGMLSYNDKHICKSIEETQFSDANSIPCYRLSSHLKSKKRCNEAKKWVEANNPEWLSLQFVPYAYNDRGLTAGLWSQLKKIGCNRKWHIMFHELWIGKSVSYSFKNRFYRFLQEKSIKRLNNNLSAECKHTHLPFYQRVLNSNLKPLPLFSNINNDNSPNELKYFNSVIIGFFSQVSLHISIVSFIKAINEQIVLQNKKLVIKLIGGNKKRNEQFEKYIKELVHGNIDVEITGFLDSIKLSSQLKSCDLGLTIVPRHALGKSGSVAAFISHGVPVAAPVVLKDYKTMDIGFFNSKLKLAILTKPDLLLIKEKKKAAIDSKDLVSLSKITTIFLRDLNIK